jgi:hypothetical protein
MRPAVRPSCFRRSLRGTRTARLTRILRLGRRLVTGEVAYLELVKSVDSASPSARRGSRAKQEAAPRAKPTKKAESGLAAEGAEKPKRGRKRDEVGAPAPAKKRTRTGVKTG